jgi:hypothetical protein
MRRVGAFGHKACLTFGLLALQWNFVAAENWPGWRGPRGDGTSSEMNVPVHWNPASNVVWKTEIPGDGHASPIVWNDRVFVVSALAGQQTRALFCLDSTGGRIRGRRPSSPRVRGETPVNSHAQHADDGWQTRLRRVSDQEGMLVAAYDFNGKQQWLVDPEPSPANTAFAVRPFCSGQSNRERRSRWRFYIVALSRGDGRWPENAALESRVVIVCRLFGS